MDVLKSHFRLSALVLSIIFTNTVLAAESTSNESEDNRAVNNSSNADLNNNVKADVVASPIETQAITAASKQQGAQGYRKQFEERRREMQQAQLEAYKQFLERRKKYSAYSNAEFNNNIPAHVQERRNEFIKQMEERRTLNVRMMEEQRKAADERRKAMQLKMHQTYCAPESTSEA